LRSGAVARQEPLRLTWLHTAQGSGWAVHSGEADACSADATASPPITCGAGTELLRSAWWPLGARVAVQANIASMRVDPRQGTVTPTGSWDMSSSDGVRLRHVVNILGRVRVCTPGPAVSGVPPC
jgi:type IV fimbrial biogenesis protein FimT